VKHGSSFCDGPAPDGFEILMGTKMRRESVIRRSRRALPAGERIAICSVLVVVTSCIWVSGQNVVLTGSLGGRVVDQNGAIVLGASVVVRNLATGVHQSADTNYAGLYRFPVLMPGTYSITASFKGFRDVQALVRVLVGNATSQDIKLRVGASTDTVNVTGTPPLLRPQESSASTVLERSARTAAADRSSALIPYSPDAGMFPGPRDCS